MKPILIKDLLTSAPDGRTVTVCGWVRTKRDSKNLVFIQVNDGSCFANIQLTFDRSNPQGADADNIENELKRINTGTSVKAEGVIRIWSISTAVMRSGLMTKSIFISLLSISGA